MVDNKEPAGEKTFESNLNRLKELVSVLEEGNLSLEESLKFFEEGIRIYRECNEVLNKAEQKITLLLSEDNDVAREVPFSIEEEE
ncbi:MAG: exodeoxyribonuclease small subunit [Candidatus Petromonas sp.]|nr:exodeoxyribonuclease small subunit [Candidatus Petromonas sp.]